MFDLISSQTVLDAGLLVGMFVALIAGLLSFLSPCVLPIAAPYLAYMGGVSVSELDDNAAARRKVMLASVFFVMGLSTVFLFYGYSASKIGELYFAVSSWANYVGGALVILFGLHFLNVFRIPLLQREARIEVKDQGGSAFGAYLLGLAFAFGWTPCIGPILGTVLTLAANEAEAARGAAMLAAYAFGLGVPFLAIAFFFPRMKGFINWMKRHMQVIERVSGVLLVIIGLLLITGRFTMISNWLLNQFPGLAAIG
jgi:cytochrome c-type biogenesis protein